MVYSSLGEGSGSLLGSKSLERQGDAIGREVAEGRLTR